MPAVGARSPASSAASAGASSPGARTLGSAARRPSHRRDQVVHRDPAAAIERRGPLGVVAGRRRVVAARRRGRSARRAASRRAGAGAGRPRRSARAIVGSASIATRRARAREPVRFAADARGGRREAGGRGRAAAGRGSGGSRRRSLACGDCECRHDRTRPAARETGPSRARRPHADPADRPGERRLAHPPSDRYRAAEAPAPRRPTAAASARPAPRSSRSLTGDRRRRRDRAARRRPDADHVPGASLAPAIGWAVARAVKARGRRQRAAVAARAAGAAPRRRRGRRSARSACGSTPGREGGVLPLVDYLGEVYGPLVPLEFAGRGGRRLGRRPMSDDVRFRRPGRGRPPADSSARSTSGGAGGTLHQLLPAPLVPAFHRDVVDRRGRATGALVGFLVGFISPDHPDEAYIHMVGDEPEPPARRARPAAVRALLRGRGRARGVRRVTAVTWPGNRVSVAFHRAMGFSADDGPGTQRLYGTPAYPDYDGRRRRPGRASAGSCEPDRRRRQLLAEQAPEPRRPLGARARRRPSARAAPRPRRRRRRRSATAGAR